MPYPKGKAWPDHPLNKITDDEIVEAWIKTPSITTIANQFGISHRRLAMRVAGLRANGRDLSSPDTRSQYFAAGEAKILLLDIETAPNRAYVWGTWKQNINPEWIDAAGYILCWTAKWLGEDGSVFKRLKEGNHKSLLGPIHKMLSEAHAVIHYNGTSFDIPTLNKEFITHGFTPPAPYKEIDLLLTMRDRFRFPSNKLDYICQSLAIGEKLRHEGPQLWLDCMANKQDAWKKMEAYNRRDVELLEKLYRKLVPWIRRHPNIAALAELACCVACGSSNIKLDKTYLATQLKYQQYKCGDCGTWFRGTKSISPRKAERFAVVA